MDIGTMDILVNANIQGISWINMYSSNTTSSFILGSSNHIHIYYVSFMINTWDTVSTFIHLHKMFLSMDIQFEEQIG